jgi:hypothetical protein
MDGTKIRERETLIGPYAINAGGNIPGLADGEQETPRVCVNSQTGSKILDRSIDDNGPVSSQVGANAVI